MSDIYGQKISIFFRKLLLILKKDRLCMLTERLACMNLVTLHSLYRPYSGGHTKCSPQNAVDFLKTMPNALITCKNGLLNFSVK